MVSSRGGVIEHTAVVAVFQSVRGTLPSPTRLPGSPIPAYLAGISLMHSERPVASQPTAACRGIEVSAIMRDVARKYFLR